MKAFCAWWPLNDLDGPWPAISQRAQQLTAAVDAVSEDVAQPWEGAAQGVQQRDSAMTVLDIGRMHEHGEQEALCIGDDVPLAALDALAGIHAAWAATFRGWHALAVDDPGRGDCTAPRRLARLGHQAVVHPMPGAIVAPPIEVPLHRRARGKVLRQGAPLAAGGVHIEDRVEDRAQIPLARTPQTRRQRKQRCNHCPLLIRHVACIAQALALILNPGDFSPRHCVLHRISTIRRNHNGLKSLNSFPASL